MQTFKISSLLLVLLTFSLNATAQSTSATPSSVCATATLLLSAISQTSCVPVPTVTSTTTRTKTVAPPCSARSAQLYVDPTPGAKCSSSFSAQKRQEVVPGQCVNVASSAAAGLTPDNYMELVGNDALPGEKCLVNLFDVADCKGAAKFSYASSVAGSDGDLSTPCVRFAIAPKSANPKPVVSFKYTCGCANVNSAKMLFDRDVEGVTFVA